LDKISPRNWTECGQGWVIGPWTRRRWRYVDEMAPLPKKDVVIIGMGAAGGTASHVLTQAGLDVVGLEAGPRLKETDFLKRLDEVGEDFSIRNSLGGVKFNREIPTWRPNAKTPTSPPLAVGMANCVGGSTVHYTACFWRFLESDFNIRSETVKKYGKGALPEGAVVDDWPMTYQDLEPYYDKVEYQLGVSGEAGANPFEAPRRRGYPLPPLQSFGLGELMGEAMRKSGYNPFPQPSSILSEPYEGRPACTYCGFCTTGYGCWNNSKGSTLITSIAEAEKTGHLEVRELCRALEIMTDSDGKASGVKYLDQNQREQIQPARFVILGTYVYENNRMLLLSKSKAYPKGLSNNHDQVGKYYRAQVNASVTGLFPGKAMNVWAGTASQGVVMDDFNGDNFDHTGLGFIRGASISTACYSMPIGQAVNVSPAAGGIWGSKYKRWLHENAGSIGALGAQMETLAYDANSIDLDPVKKDDLGIPVARLTFDIYENEKRMAAYLTKKMEPILKEAGAKEVWTTGEPSVVPVYSHAYGGTVMGDDPESSVVDGYSVSHEVPNLSVMGASTFVSVTGYNPTETLQAVAWYGADHIAKNFEQLAAD
jgi:gluconate 2-dehydrogenase alpha chain